MTLELIPMGPYGPRLSLASYVKMIFCLRVSVRDPIGDTKKMATKIVSEII